ncbi:MAG: hypothetical protein AB7P14_01425 [Blastocatellales bacterium]
MRSMSLKLKASFFCIVLVCLGAVVINAQPQRRPEPDPLQRLKHALQLANAQALTTAQEDQLKTLIQQARDARPDEPDTALQAAHAALESAIFAGNQAAADAQATIIAGLTSAMVNNRVKEHSAFTIQAINVLRGNQGQLEGLVQKIGSSGVVNLMGSLVGGGPGGPPGPGGGRPGGFGGPPGQEDGRPSPPARP